ncbi:MAG: oxidoreductase [Lentisphaeria bacterium]|nr:oxidoreductase [Lentisphaeria bacterium]
MRIAASVISIHSSDTAGVCSALYELGGLTVVHDASGCNSTYATHDEPRWYAHGARTYISALTETDAIMGNDERFIDNVVSAAKDLGDLPFIAICGSPLPMMVGTDFNALGAEIERRSGIPVLALHTNGIKSYLAGVNQALCALAERFCRDGLKKNSRKVNILGATPLDFSVNGEVENIRRILEENGFEVNSCWSMGSSLEELSSAGAAGVNLLISSSAKELAQYFEKRFSIPFVAGVPVGRAFAACCIRALKKAAGDGESSMPCLSERTPAGDAAVIGESLFASSLCCALQMEQNIACHLLNPLEKEFAFMHSNEMNVPDESAVAGAFAKVSRIYGDPLYAPVAAAEKCFIPVPHEAFSGRCFRKKMRSLCGKDLKKEFEIC